MVYAPDQIPVQRRDKKMQPERDGSLDRKRRQALHPTAGGTSSPEGINVTPIPLYLIPHAVADEIRRYGLRVRVIHVHRTRNHQYIIKVECA
jgi:hypothetical protein